MNDATIEAIADALLAAHAGAASLAPITDSMPDFDVAAAYRVLHEIERRRVAQDWRPVGRKIGFTNRTLWPRYGVDRPMWAHVWRETVSHAADGQATLSLAGMVLPRIEPEVVFGLRGPVPVSGDAQRVMDAVDWIAPGFEIVQSHFPQWRFKVPDCTAAFGLHAALVVGPRTPVNEANRSTLAALLPRFELTLRSGERSVESGIGANVLDSPAAALAFLARVLEDDPDAAPLEAGELVTTGTLTDAWPVTAGQSWSSDYGDLGISGLRVTLA
ncbi:MAG: decarboxylase [Burkholderiales bacterium]|nr:decarboxylase [Burkholderiales bacterium]